MNIVVSVDKNWAIGNDGNSREEADEYDGSDDDGNHGYPVPALGAFLFFLQDVVVVDSVVLAECLARLLLIDGILQLLRSLQMHDSLVGGRGLHQFVESLARV